jgi:5'-methylthioinosine phosphorylase
MLAIIGGTGLSDLNSFEQLSEEVLSTPYSDSPVRIYRFNCAEGEFLFLPRHGRGHKIPPHRINYRANIWALSQLKTDNIVAVNAVGGISSNMGPSVFAVPDQIIDYSYGRQGTFFDEGMEQVSHIDFTFPYNEKLRQLLLMAATKTSTEGPGFSKGEQREKQQIVDGGVYGCTQGPRLETAAEVIRLQRDGCDMVGMTGMPEAALARELNIPYASLALSVNWAAGLAEQAITMEDIEKVLDKGMGFISAVLVNLVAES